MGPQAALGLTARQRQATAEEIEALRRELTALTERQRTLFARLRLMPPTSVPGQNNMSQACAPCHRSPCSCPRELSRPQGRGRQSSFA